MEDFVIISLICICNLVSSSPIYSDTPTLFRHRGEAISHRSLRDDSNQQNTGNQWAERYYHMKRPEFDRDLHSANAPDEFLSFMTDLLNQQPHENNEDDAYLPAFRNRNVNPLRFNPPFVGDDDNNDDTVDYRDNYNIAPSVLDPPQMDENFQQALADYLLQAEQQSKDSNKQLEISNDSQAKSMLVAEKSTEPPTTSASSTVPAFSTAVKATTEALTQTDDNSQSSNLSVMPPVSTGKGQKEFPMLRPASDNNRKFDKWEAQNLANSMSANVLQGSPRIQQQYPADSLTEELNKLKSQNQHGIKKSQDVWY